MDIKIKLKKNPNFTFLQVKLGFNILWSRRESNPGPNKQPKGFLRAYFLFKFSTFD